MLGSGLWLSLDLIFYGPSSAFGYPLSRCLRFLGKLAAQAVAVPLDVDDHSAIAHLPAQARVGVDGAMLHA